MKKNIAPLIILTLLTTACDDDDYSHITLTQETTDTQEETTDTIADTDTIPEATYLLYMVGDSELSSYLTDNITDLKTGYSTTDINANILIYTDLDDTPLLLRLTKGDNDTVRTDTILTYPDQYSTDPDVMTTVITQAFNLYPATRKGITFSSHANGSFYTSNTPVKKRSFGSEGDEGYSMNITDIREALDSCPHLNMIMFDACLMGNIETAYELKDNTDYFLATPNSVPGAGFPYDEILPSLLLMDDEGLTQAAEEYMNHYHSNKLQWDDFVAVSLTDCTNLTPITTLLDSLFQDTDTQQRLYTLNRNNLQMFEEGYYLYDVGDWIDSLGLQSPYVEQIHDAISQAIIYAAHSDYGSVSDYGELLIPVDDARFCGLNTYVPPMNPFNESAFMAYFTTLRWYADGGFTNAIFYSWFERYAEML